MSLVYRLLIHIAHVLILAIVLEFLDHALMDRVTRRWYG